ncbi:MAG: hypothetical protein J2O39_06715 [Acidimicrobiales bacterium]|nr:hypothetical protein [Acidimicrobiales bacterium]MBO0894051.1 hypothetical protein [Acidimicrobiales bacterium]
MAQADTSAVDVEPLLEAIEYCYEQGWTDGLPVVPPSPGLVQRFLEHTKRRPEDEIWHMPQVYRSCTVALAAINAAMAGCRPEYFPVVLAALDATIDEGWPGTGGWQSTTGGGPMHIVNGPVRTELGFNSMGNVFGQGFRPNATVGRAIRLIIMNVYGIVPHVLDQSTQGTPGKYTMCIAENEEESPWEPLHVELGFPADASTVSAMHVRSSEFVDNRGTADAEQLLNDIADTISRTGTVIRRQKRCGVVFGPEHANLIAAQGFSKTDVKRYLAEHSGRRASDLRRAGKGSARRTGGPGTSQAPVPGAPDMSTWAGPDDAGSDDEFVPMIDSPDDLLVVVAGAGNAGVTTVCHPLGFPRHIPGRALVER